MRRYGANSTGTSRVSAVPAASTALSVVAPAVGGDHGKSLPAGALPTQAVSANRYTVPARFALPRRLSDLLSFKRST